LVVSPQSEREQRITIECKVLRDGLDATATSGLEQLAGYMNSCDAEQVRLVVLDMGSARWQHKVSRRTEPAPGDMRVQVWGM